MKSLVLWIGFQILLFGVTIQEGHYALGKEVVDQGSLKSYFDQQGIDNVYRSTVCRDGCKGDKCCYSVIKNHNGKILKRFGSDDSVETIATGRYTTGAYLLYRHSFYRGDTYYSSYHLIDADAKNYPLPTITQNYALAALITKEQKLLQVQHDGLYLDSKLIASLDHIDLARIQNNPEGDIAVGAVDDQGILYASNMQQWLKTPLSVALHSDRDGILGLYPYNSDTLYLTLYNRVNIYNKGLMGAVVDMKTRSSHGGWLFNSEKENIGFDPQLYIRGEDIVIHAYNSSRREPFTMELTQVEFHNVDQHAPQHIEGFENEEFLGFLLGGRLSYKRWSAGSEVEIDNHTYAKVDYEISDALFSSLYLEAKIFNTHMALSYLRNQAREVGGLTQKASEVLNFLVDFDGLISPSSTLRLVFDRAQINGIAQYSSRETNTLTPDKTTVSFSSEYTNIALYNMLERGWYFGGAYSEYTMPNAIGFSGSSHQVEYVGMDEALKLHSYTLEFGYDEISYARRYESNLARLYIQAMGAIGIRKYKLSSEMKDEVGRVSGKDVQSTSYGLSLKGNVDIGYIYQQRFKSARGLGYALTCGYKVEGGYGGTGQSDSTNTAANELRLEQSRYDIWHGPYIGANILY